MNKQKKTIYMVDNSLFSYCEIYECQILKETNEKYIVKPPHKNYTFVVYKNKMYDYNFSEYTFDYADAVNIAIYLLNSHKNTTEHRIQADTISLQCINERLNKLETINEGTKHYRLMEE